MFCYRKSSAVRVSPYCDIANSLESEEFGLHKSGLVQS